MSDSEDDTNKKKEPSVFKKRYDNDPEFRKQHIEKMSESISCDCGATVKRCNMSVHRRSMKHKTWLNTNADIICDCGIQVDRKNMNSHKETKEHKSWLNKQLNIKMPIKEILSLVGYVPDRTLMAFFDKKGYVLMKKEI